MRHAVLRAALLSRKLGINAEVVGSPTARYFLPSAFLREFEPDFFFDDQSGHVSSAARHVPAGHVNSGVSNPDADPLK